MHNLFRSNIKIEKYDQCRNNKAQFIEPYVIPGQDKNKRCGCSVKKKNKLTRYSKMTQISNNVIFLSNHIENIYNDLQKYYDHAPVV